jgi:hypothetical protein
MQNANEAFTTWLVSTLLVAVPLLVFGLLAILVLAARSRSTPNLINCPGCGSGVSPHAPTCPRCGKAMK